MLIVDDVRSSFSLTVGQAQAAQECPWGSTTVGLTHPSRSWLDLQAQELWTQSSTVAWEYIWRTCTMTTLPSKSLSSLNAPVLLLLSIRKEKLRAAVTMQQQRRTWLASLAQYTRHLLGYAVGMTGVWNCLNKLAEFEGWLCNPHLDDISLLKLECLSGSWHSKIFGLMLKIPESKSYLKVDHHWTELGAALYFFLGFWEL